MSKPQRAFNKQSLQYEFQLFNLEQKQLQENLKRANWRKRGNKAKVLYENWSTMRNFLRKIRSTKINVSRPYRVLNLCLRYALF